MARHIRSLGLKDANAYLDWCLQMGAAVSLEKSAQERALELAIPERRQAALRAQERLHRNPRRFLEEACAGRLEPAAITRPGWREAAFAIARSKDGEDRRASLAAFLLHVHDVSDLVFETATLARQQRLYLEGLIRLHDRRGQWIRDPTAWRPDSHNLGRQFSSLARHLLARYTVPVFLDAAWLRSDRGAYRFRDWFVHVGKGRNIRTAKTPYPLTKMIAHHFVRAPDDMTIEGALMLADIRSLGGGGRLAHALMGTRLGQRIESDAERRAFWLSVYRFFIANPMLDLRHAGPIVDFLAFQKFDTQEVMVAPGRVEVRAPPQPNLSMARRTPEALLRQVEAWHGELRRARRTDKRFWKPSGVPGFASLTGPRDRPQEQTHWTVRELLSAQELIDEGRRMRHCVATFVESCSTGESSIWSLERRRGAESKLEPLLTIEIDADGVMVEARGFANRWPTDQEKRVLEAWMKHAGLRPGPYLYAVI
jgi:hypothetical protein